MSLNTRMRNEPYTGAPLAIAERRDFFDIGIGYRFTDRDDVTTSIAVIRYRGQPLAVAAEHGVDEQTGRDVPHETRVVGGNTLHIWRTEADTLGGSTVKNPPVSVPAGIVSLVSIVARDKWFPDRVNHGGSMGAFSSVYSRSAIDAAVSILNEAWPGARILSNNIRPESVVETE